MSVHLSVVDHGASYEALNPGDRVDFYTYDGRLGMTRTYLGTHCGEPVFDIPWERAVGTVITDLSRTRSASR